MFSPQDQGLFSLPTAKGRTVLLQDKGELFCYRVWRIFSLQYNGELSSPQYKGDLSFSHSIRVKCSPHSIKEICPFPQYKSEVFSLRDRENRLPTVKGELSSLKYKRDYSYLQYKGEFVLQLTEKFLPTVKGELSSLKYKRNYSYLQYKGQLFYSLRRNFSLQNKGDLSSLQYKRDVSFPQYKGELFSLQCTEELTSLLYPARGV